MKESGDDARELEKEPIWDWASRNLSAASHRLLSPADRFERAVSEQQYGGFGLGLWIVREIAVAMGGEVSVTSQPGKGATFYFVLPRISPP